MSTISRRAILGLMASAGVSAALSAKARGLGEGWARPDPDDSSRWLFLWPEEVAFLVAAVDRFIPEDDFPSASQSGVVDYLDMQLATAWGDGASFYLQPPFRPDIAAEGQGYQHGLTPAALYREAIAALLSGMSQPLGEMSPEDQDAFLTRLSEGEVDAGAVAGKAFFDMLLQDTIEGYFADPIHGGNFNMVSWQMVGFPGADAYYTTTVDNFGMEYFKAPSSVRLPAGAGAPRSAPRPLRETTLRRGAGGGPAAGGAALTREAQ